MSNQKRNQEAWAAAEKFGGENHLAFVKGVQWADAHPSEQMLKKAVYLYKRWLTNQSGLNMIEFIKKNWNIEI